MLEKFFTELFGHDGSNNYVNHAVDLKGKSIYNSNQLSSLTSVNTPTLRAAIIEFSDASTSGATDLISKSCSTNVMPFNATYGIDIYKIVC